MAASRFVRTIKCLALTGGVLISVAGAVSAGPTDAEKCVAGKLKLSGKLFYCSLKGQAKSLLSGGPLDTSACDLTFAQKWNDIETKYGDLCPTTGDSPGIQADLSTRAAELPLRLGSGGTRFVDNGDQTITDKQTGLMWEKKDNFGGIHDVNGVNRTLWSATDTNPDGDAFTVFLGTLNNGFSTDGTTVTDCFARHCDWRLPTITELQTIIDLNAPGCHTGVGGLCIDAVFGPVNVNSLGDYWSSTTDAGTHGGEGYAWIVDFYDGFPYTENKVTHLAFVRAVRGGP